MIRIISALCISSIALISVSCCVTSESGAPPLRPLPKFREIETVTPSVASEPAPAEPIKVHREK